MNVCGCKWRWMIWVTVIVVTKPINSRGKLRGDAWFYVLCTSAYFYYSVFTRYFLYFFTLHTVYLFCTLSDCWKSCMYVNSDNKYCFEMKWNEMNLCNIKIYLSRSLSTYRWLLQFCPLVWNWHHFSSQFKVIVTSEWPWTHLILSQCVFGGWSVVTSNELCIDWI